VVSRGSTTRSLPRATGTRRWSEQVLYHVLPALAKVKPGSRSPPSTFRRAGYLPIILGMHAPDDKAALLAHYESVAARHGHDPDRTEHMAAVVPHRRLAPRRRPRAESHHARIDRPRRGSVHPPQVLPTAPP
jgi:hypothetical protein